MELIKLLEKLDVLGVLLSIDKDELVLKVTKEKIPVELITEIKKCKSQIINELIGGSKVVFKKINPCEKKKYYKLSSAQRRLYLMQQMDLGSTAYNTPFSIPLGAEVDKEKIEKVFHQLISRHESFRTSFTVVGEEPVQVIYERVKFKIEKYNIKKGDDGSIQEKFVEPFDLSQAPLLRVAILNIQGARSLLVIDMHHIISDGVSQTILEEDFQRLYVGEDLPALRLQYKDYSKWQNGEEQQQKKEEQESYWLGKFEGEIPLLNLPTDFIRPAVQRNEGSSVSFVLNEDEIGIIKTVSKENSLTLYLSLLSVFAFLLAKLSGQEDIIVGTPTTGRNHLDLENIVGMFVNTVAIRMSISKEINLKILFKQVKQTALEAFDNQDYQFDELVDKKMIKRDSSRNPIFNVLFNFRTQKDTPFKGSEFKNNELVIKQESSKFDLTLIAIDYDEYMYINFIYNINLFKEETFIQFIEYFRGIIKQLPEKLDSPLSEMHLNFNGDSENMEDPLSMNLDVFN